MTSAVVPTAVAAFTVLAIVAFVKYKTRRVAVVVAYVAFLFVAMTLSPAGVSDMYARARDTYVKGDYSIAEGAVAFTQCRIPGIRTKRFPLAAWSFRTPTM